MLAPPTSRQQLVTASGVGISFVERSELLYLSVEHHNPPLCPLVGGRGGGPGTARRPPYLDSAAVPRLESQVQASQSQQRMKQRLECDEKHDFLPALSPKPASQNCLQTGIARPQRASRSPEETQGPSAFAGGPNCATGSDSQSWSLGIGLLESCATNCS